MASKPCILVVDDEAPHRRLFQRLLAPQWDVLEAESGIFAIELLRTHAIDLVLLDALMPGQDGFDTCRLIKAEPRDLFMPVVLVTTLGEQEDRNRGLEAGADEFLHKPVDPRELLLRVGGLLRLREQERTIRAQVEEVRRLEALKDDMVSLLIHDLRNPLSGILSSLELALEDPRGPQVEADLRRALQSAESLRGSLDETLQVRLLEENAIVAQRKPADLSDVVGAAIADLSSVARRRGIEVRCTLEGDAKAPIDARLVQRSLENLLSNALKYAPRGSEISVQTRNGMGFVEIEVADRGPGIPGELKGVLFERFGSVEASRGKARRGIGLGLYLVKLVAAAHDGDVSAHDRPGGGTIFRLRLAPRRKPDSQGAAQEGGVRPRISG